MAMSEGISGGCTPTRGGVGTVSILKPIAVLLALVDVCLLKPINFEEDMSFLQGCADRLGIEGQLFGNCRD
jgi:hypothetical protein